MSDVALRRLSRTRLLPRKRISPRLAAGIGLLVLTIPVIAVANWLDPVSPFALHTADTLQPPSLSYPLGTDPLGRDMLARLLSGGVETLIVAGPAAVIAFLVGTAWGLAAGLGPRWLDQILMRLLDAMLALPSLMVLMFFAALTRLDRLGLMLLLGFLAWPWLAKLVRNEIVAHRNRDFILAARQFGAGPIRIALRHLLPLLAPLLVANATLLAADMIFSLSAMSFLGLGVQPPYASWGGMLDDGLKLIAGSPWWLIVPPGLMIFGVLFGATLVADALATETRSRSL